MIGNVYIPVRFLPVCHSEERLEAKGSGKDEETAVYGFMSLQIVQVDNKERVHAKWTRRERRMTVPYETMTGTVGSHQECTIKWLFVKSRQLVGCKFVSLLVSYCYDIPDGKDMSEV